MAVSGGVMSVLAAARRLGLSPHVVRSMVGTGELQAGPPRQTANGRRALMTVDADSVAEVLRRQQAEAATAA